MTKFSEEEKRWLKENYPLDESRQETYIKFCERFGNIRSFISIKAYCKRNHLNKPQSRQRFQSNHLHWATGLKGDEFKKHFTIESYNNSKNTYKNNFPHLKNRSDYNVPEGYVLSDLGNNELLLIEKSIYKRMMHAQVLGQGELTKAIYETYLAKREIEKISGKRLFSQKSKQTVIAKKGDETYEFPSIRKAAKQLSIPYATLHKAIYGNTNNTGYIIYIKEKKLC